MQPNLPNRTLFCHDNLEVLQGMNSESVDLIYLDPPFNKKKEFTAPIGSSAEGASFKDFFREEDVKDEWLDDIREDFPPIHDFLKTVKSLNSLGAKGKSNHYLYNYCYLTYMARRLIEMQRVLKDSGSLYLHCDPTMSHYLKILLDLIFGEKHFRNEVVWHYYNGASTSNKVFGRKHDVILFYAKNPRTPFCSVLREPHDPTSGWMTTQKESVGYGTPNPEGKRVHDVWRIPSINNMSKERVGYPTQKPLALLERLIKASCPEEGLVLDPFCGCATTCVAAEKLGRKWVGIDVSVKAYELVKVRLAREVKGEVFSAKGETDQHHEAMFNWEKEIVYTTTPPKRTDLGEDYRERKYVYVVSHPLYRGYKVGIAKDVKQRLNAYQASDPDRQYKLEYSVLTPSFREVERKTHERFHAKGEWTTTGEPHEISRFIAEQVGTFSKNEAKPLAL